MKNKIKSLAIYCVNYASYTELHSYLLSIEQAAAAAVNQIKVHVYISDNTETQIEAIETKCYITISVRVFPLHKNLGYLGAIQHMMHVTDVMAYDYIAISNVDLIVAEDAFKILSNLQIDNNIGWIAPKLFSSKLNYDRNPAVMSRYTSKQLSMLRFMFQHPYINYIYKHTFYKRKKIRKPYKNGTRIYAGHGSFMLLSKEYFKRCGIPEYKTFLFCEELYIAEKCRQNNLLVVYFPEISLYDIEHVSVSKLHKPSYYQYNSESLSFILKTFYRGKN